MTSVRIEAADAEIRLRTFGRALQTDEILALTTPPHVTPQDPQDRSDGPMALITYRQDPSGDRTGLGSDHMTIRERFALDIWVDEAATRSLAPGTLDPNLHMARIREAVEVALRADNLIPILAALAAPAAPLFREVIAELISPWSFVPFPTTEDTRHLTADWELTFYQVS